jgi:endonuclease/exonuclease/phosphatase (EEP) superfamily protein YafD
MDLRRTTTLRFAALSALFTVFAWTAATPANAGEATLAPTTPVTAPITAAGTAAGTPPGTTSASARPARHTRTFFWMNAMRSNLDRRARATASARMRTDVRHIRRAGADLAVLAEVAGDQRAEFRRYAGDGWALVGGGNDVDNVVVYRRAAFTQVGHESMTTRYNGGQRIHVTIPVLRDDVTGTQVAVIPVHNPQWHTGQWRTVSLRLELAKVKQLRRTHRDWQIIIAGDFNAEASSACAFTHLGLRSPAVDKQHCGRLHAIDQMYATPQLRPHDYRSRPTPATDHRREYLAELTF